MNQYPKVSVCMITYGHEKFIEEAINGVLMQQCDFEVELIIANDCSPDKTDEIIRKLIDNHSKPSWIKYIKHDKNLGMMPNFIFAMQECKGKYIALCEGDDYWTDPLKLQKQVDVLEFNPHLVGCFHNSEERYWNDYSKASSLYVSFLAGREVSIKELTQSNIIPTASVIFKKPTHNELFSEEYLHLPIGDWPLHLLNARNGNYYYLPQVMSVRNLYPQSVWGMQNHEKNVAQVVYVYNELIQSGWFNNDVIDLLKTSCENLENSIKPQKVSEESMFKNKFINKIIRVLNKL